MDQRGSRSLRHAVAIAVLLVATATAPSLAGAAPSGQLTYAVHISLAPTWFDPSETPSLITPFMVLYAMHDALVKFGPGSPQFKALAENWSVSKDGLVYEFQLRKNVKFHNGEVMTAEDVKFSFERYKGSSAKLLKDRVAAVEVVDPHTVRFKLKKPWLDFMTFFATPATGAAWIVPKKYVEKVGDEGFKKAPIGAGPYKFVSFKPGVELVLEAHEGYWRKPPSIKTLVLRVIPDESTRLAALKRGEVDLAYSITGPLAQELKQAPNLKLVPTHFMFTTWLLFTEQWDPKSPWHDKRVRLAANLAIDRQGINQAAYLGLAKPALSFVPSSMDYFWAPPPYPFDPAKAKQLLAEAGYPNGFDAGSLFGEMIYGSAIGEPVANYLQAVGIRSKLRLMERAAFYKEYAEKKLNGILHSGSGAPGNAATRVDSYAVTGGTYTYNTYPEIDGLFSEQVNEQNPRVRAQLLHKIQQIVHDRVMFAPVMEPAFLNGVGPRVDFNGLGAIANFPYSAPYEDLTLKTK